MAADSGQCTVLVLLDLTAAFDKVHHVIMIQRLQNYFGISGRVLEWFISMAEHLRSWQMAISRSLKRSLVVFLRAQCYFVFIVFVPPWKAYKPFWKCVLPLLC